MYGRVGGLMCVVAASMMTVPSIYSMTTGPAVMPESAATVRKQRSRQAPVARHRAMPRLNRSRNWTPAESYTDARRISPVPDQPVR